MLSITGKKEEEKKAYIFLQTREKNGYAGFLVLAERKRIFLQKLRTPEDL
jgi:hypothetical protein